MWGHAPLLRRSRPRSRVLGEPTAASYPTHRATAHRRRWLLAAWRAGDRADRQGACGSRAAALQRGWARRCAALRGAWALLRPRPAAPLALSHPCGSCVLGARVCMCGELGVCAHFVYYDSAARHTPLRVAGWPVAGICRGWSLRGPNPAAVPIGSIAACVRACVLRVVRGCERHCVPTPGGPEAPPGLFCASDREWFR